METKQLLMVFLAIASSSCLVKAEYVDNDLIQDGERRSLSDLELLDIFDPSYFDESGELDQAKKENVEYTNPAEVEEPVMVAIKAPCLGCPQTIEPQNDKVQDVALFAFGEYLAKDRAGGSEDDGMETFVRVIKAERQVIRLN